MNYYGVTRSTDHLAHYGVKGMKWGVRRALARGNDKALDRHYKKASKKLAKLQDIGLNSKKYAAKATAYGAAAAGVGTIAGKFGSMTGTPTISWQSIKPGNDVDLYPVWKMHSKHPITSNIAGAAALGLTGASALNAYRAANGKKYRAKAVKWKNAMDDTFKGTKYEGKYAVPVKKKKRKVKHFDSTSFATFDELSNPDFLAHYGIKGMKWGVRKALDNPLVNGTNKKLDKQYRKAARKLEKLSERADPEAQYQKAKKYGKMIKAGAGMTVGGLAGLGGSAAGFYSLNPGGVAHYTYRPGDHAPFVNGMHLNDYNTAMGLANGLGIASGVTKLSGLGVMGAGAAKKALAKYRMTNKKYNAKAVAKRDAWKNQMAEVFKGTKYDTNKRRKSK